MGNEKVVAYEKIEERLNNDGFMVSIENKGWKGQIKVTHHDLGLTAEEFAVGKDVFTGGRLFIFPPARIRELHKIGMRAYISLRNISFKHPLGGRYITVKKLHSFIPTYENCLMDFNEQREKLKNEFKENKEKHLEKLRLYGEAQYERLNGNMVKENITKNKFVENLLDRARAAYPRIEDIDRKFSLNMHLYKMRVPSGDDIDQIDTEAHFLKEEFLTRNRKAIDDFLQDEVVSVLREKVVEIAGAIKGKVEGKEKIRKDTFDSLVKFIDDFKEMNFVGDVEVETMLNSIKRKYLNEDHEKIQGPAIQDFSKALGEVVKGVNNLGKGIGNVVMGYGKRKIKAAKK